MDLTKVQEDFILDLPFRPARDNEMPALREYSGGHEEESWWLVFALYSEWKGSNAPEKRPFMFHRRVSTRAFFFERLWFSYRDYLISELWKDFEETNVLKNGVRGSLVFGFPAHPIPDGEFPGCLRDIEGAELGLFVFDVGTEAYLNDLDYWISGRFTIVEEERV